MFSSFYFPIRTKPEKGNSFSLFECINIGAIGESSRKRKNELEFEKSVVTDDKEEYERIKTTETSKKNASASTSKPTTIEIARSVQQIDRNREQLITETKEEKSFEKKETVRRTKPKTELELKIINTQNEHPSKKKDIFKAIFDSDSDGNDSDDDTKDPDRSNEELLVSLAKASSSIQTAIYSQLPDEAFAPKSAKELNILRNTSPPRGIFSSLAKTHEMLLKAKTIECKENENLSNAKNNLEEDETDDTYGPCLPPQQCNKSDKKADFIDLTSSTANSSKSIPFGSSAKVYFEEQWIEKLDDDEVGRKSKKDKKTKKDKHKHKSKKLKKDKHKKKKR